MTTLRVGSRESELAQIQARHVMALLQARFPELTLTLATFRTTGDRHLEQRLSEIGQKGLFVKELEAALLAGEIDLAVHSLKDMPGELPEGLVLASAGEREDPRDVLVSRNGEPLFDLRKGAVIGTSSTRRVAMLRRLRPDVVCENIRGNIQTRLRKLDGGQYDAIVLAAAGMHRAGLRERITRYFDPVDELVPAPGQGILAVEYREADEITAKHLAAISYPETAAAMAAERTVLATLEAGCHTPLGAHAQVNGERLTMHIRLLSQDGARMLERRQDMACGDVEIEARQLAEGLLGERSGVF